MYIPLPQIHSPRTLQNSSVGGSLDLTQVLPLADSVGTYLRGNGSKGDTSSSLRMGPHLQDIISVRVTQVPRANLSAHVPAAERGRRELQSPNFQQHVAHRWEGIPAQAQGRKPLQPGGVRAGDQAACGAWPARPPPGSPSSACPIPSHAHVGCSRGTSRTSSGGRTKSSGGSSGAWSSRGSTSKRPFPGVQPC